ncbi:MAG: Na+/H+ antiporter [Nocardioidaceae bacterium]|nr:Na+/H+ antiporter [Nocardioidaceae bacterium]
MEIAVLIVVSIAVVILVSALSHRTPFPAPLLLVVLGLAGSFLPGVPDVDLSADIVLFGFLPPLLYSAALNTSLIDFHKNARPIALLSVGLVIATTLTVGLVAWWLLPIQPAAALALGAVVSPPDAVAATAIARRVGMPRRVVTILQGESLVNDATALVALRTAIAAIGGSVTVLEVGLDFALAAVGGIAVGVVVAFVTGKVRKRIDDEITDTAVSLLTPFVSYLTAEQFHFSGILAVVFTGLILGHKTHLMQSAPSRIFERNNWSTIDFLLENAVFLLIGLQVREILEATASSALSTSQVVGACVSVTLTVMVVRVLWVFPATYLPRLIPAVRAKDPLPPWTFPAAVSWAGMRGVVTLAAAFVLPPETPHREVLVLIALVVVGVTLLLQGATLPWVLRHLGLSGPDPGEDALQVASVNQRASSAGLRRLDEITTDGNRDDVIERVRRRSGERSDAMWERLGSSDETPSQEYARLRIEMIAAEREELLRLRDQGLVHDDVLRQVFAAIDIEETVLGNVESVTLETRNDELTSPPLHTGCEHLADRSDTPTPNTPDGCEECLAEGLDWVHLRLCMSCGHVGCCDSSVGKHASHHYADRSHPVVRSFEPGEAWRWCFVDERLG